MTVSAVTMKLKFPEFSDVADATIEFAIEEASRNVDDSWLSKDQDLGLMYLSAHYLMVTISRAESASGEQVKAERFGEISISYATPNQPTAASFSDLTTTPYGTRFQELVTLNFPPIAII